jgi:hypothetical protein
MIAILLAVCVAGTLMAQSHPVIKEYISYEKWVDQDVAYIISDEEAAEFKLLKSNDDRDQFIESFWLRRDPTPGTVENRIQSRALSPDCILE